MSSKALYNSLNIIGLLFEHDANPTIKSNDEKIPKEMAVTNSFKIGAVLFGNLVTTRYNATQTQVNSHECSHECTHTPVVRVLDTSIH